MDRVAAKYPKVNPENRYRERRCAGKSVIPAAFVAGGKTTPPRRGIQWRTSGESAPRDIDGWQNRNTFRGDTRGLL